MQYILILFVSILQLTNHMNIIPCFHTQKVNLFTSAPSVNGYSPTGYQTTIIWKKPFIGVPSFGLALAGYIFKAPALSLSFDAFLINITNIQGVLNFNPHLNTFVNLVDFVIVLAAPDCNGAVQLITINYNTIILNTVPRTSSFQQFTTPLTVVSGNINIFSVFLSCFHYISNSGRQQLNVQIRSFISPTLTIAITTNNDDHIVRVTILIMVISNNILSPQIVYHKLEININMLNKLNYTNNFNILQGLINFDYSQYCLIGIRAMNLYNNYSPTVMTYQQNLNLTDFNIDNPTLTNFIEIFCIAQCDVGTQSVFGTGNLSSDPCTPIPPPPPIVIPPHCIRSNNISNECSICLPMYYLDQNKACSLCSSNILYCHICANNNSNNLICQLCFIGEIVIGGCTTQPGCIQVTQHLATTNFHQAYCLTCRQPQYSSYLGGCVCVGKIVTGVCLIMPGCIEAKRVNRVPVCTGCDINAEFNLVNSVCECKQGYVPIGQACTQICGDRKVFHDECDDGNLLNGDGCSSACKTERGYHCFNGNHNHQSDCIYMLTDVSLSLEYADKIDFVNQGKFVFKISPLIGRFDAMNFQNAINFTCNANFTIKSVTYTNGYIEVLVPYTTDLERQVVNFTVNFDQKIINLTSLQVIFTVHSRGVQLIIQSYEPYYAIIQYINTVLAYTALAAFLVGLWFSKMLSVEIINLFQLIFLSHFMTKHYTESVMVFRYFTSSMLNFLFDSNKSSNVYLYSMQKLAYNQHNNLLSISIVAGTFLLCYLPVTCLQLLLIHRQDRAEILHQREKRYFYYKQVTKEQIKIKQENKGKPGIPSNKICSTSYLSIIENKIYDRILFPTAIGFFYLIVLTINVSNFQHLKNIVKMINEPHQLAILTIFINICLGLIFFNEWKIIFKSFLINIYAGKRFKKQKNKYISVYLTYCFINAVVIIMQYSDYIEVGLQLIFANTLLYMISLWRSPPYANWINNLSLYFNNAVTLVFIGWMIARENYQFVRRQKSEFPMLIVIVTMLTASLAIIVVRIVFLFIVKVKQLCNKQHSYVSVQFPDVLNELSNQQKQDFFKDSFKNINKYSLQKQVQQDKMNHMMVQNLNRKFNETCALYIKRDVSFLQSMIRQKIQNQNQISQLLIDSKNSKLAKFKKNMRNIYKRQHLNQIIRDNEEQ